MPGHDIKMPVCYIAVVPTSVMLKFFAHCNKMNGKENQKSIFKFHNFFEKYKKVKSSWILFLLLSKAFLKIGFINSFGILQKIYHWTGWVISNFPNHANLNSLKMHWVIAYRKGIWNITTF